MNVRDIEGFAPHKCRDSLAISTASLRQDFSVEFDLGVIVPVPATATHAL